MTSDTEAPESCVCPKIKCPNGDDCEAKPHHRRLDEPLPQAVKNAKPTDGDQHNVLRRCKKHLSNGDVCKTPTIDHKAPEYQSGEDCAWCKEMKLWTEFSGDSQFHDCEVIVGKLSSTDRAFRGIFDEEKKKGGQASVQKVAEKREQIQQALRMLHDGVHLRA